MSDFFVELVVGDSDEIVLVSATSAAEAFAEAERLRPGGQAIDAWLADALASAGQE